VTPLRTSKYEGVTLTVCIAVSAIVYVVNPIIVRSLLDGFMPTQDRAALGFGVATLGIFELCGLLCAFLMRRSLDMQVSNYVFRTRMKTIEHVTIKRRTVDKNSLQLAMSVTIPSLGNQLIRYPWQMARDVVLATLVSIVALSINYRCAFAILALVVLHFVVAIFMRNTSRISTAVTREAETSLLNRWVMRLPVLWDRGQGNSETELLKADLAAVHESLLNKDRLRSKLDDLGRAIRTLAVVATLWIALDGVSDGSVTNGTLWALLILIFRLNQPIVSLLRGILGQEKKTRDLRKIGFELFRNRGEAKKKASPKLSRVFDEALRSNSHLHLNVHANKLVELANTLRAWQARVPSSVRVCILDASWNEDETLPAANIYVFVGMLKSLSFEACRKMADSIAVNQPSAQLWTIDSIPWLSVPAPLLYCVSSLDISDVNAIRLDAPIKEDLTTEVLNHWESDDFRFRDLRRDLVRHLRLGAPASLLLVRDFASRNESRGLVDRIRATDHCIQLLGGHCLLGLMGTGEDKLELAYARLAKDDGERAILKNATNLRLRTDVATASGRADVRQLEAVLCTVALRSIGQLPKREAA
jgi:hypothetical protein